MKVIGVLFVNFIVWTVIGLLAVFRSRIHEKTREFLCPVDHQSNRLAFAEALIRLQKISDERLRYAVETMAKDTKSNMTYKDILKQAIEMENSDLQKEASVCRFIHHSVPNIFMVTQQIAFWASPE